MPRCSTVTLPSLNERSLSNVSLLPNPAGFRESKFKVLVATDVASRGLDIPNVDLVIQLEPPKDVETYIHR